MPLGEIGPFWEWLEREDPSYLVGTLVRQWIEDAGDSPWQAPSVPIPQVSNQPDSEVRRVVVPDTNIEVYYRQTYATNVVDLIAVTKVVVPPTE